MNRSLVIVGLVVATAAGLALAEVQLADRSNEVAKPSEAILSLGRTTYAESCASCHGADLEGQPDWKSPLPSGRLPAPPHDASGHTWHHSDAMLFRVVKEGTAAVVGGDYESDMPAFQDVLTDEEIRAVLAFIKSTWPDREREAQAQISRNDKEKNR